MKIRKLAETVSRVDKLPAIALGASIAGTNPVEWIDAEPYHSEL